MTLLTTLIGTLLFAVAGPVVGCLLAGLDRIISARMQGRVGPPLLQPYYDVRKLFEKERVSVNSVEGVYVACALLFALIAGGIFYSGGNLLLCVFVITLSSLFFIMAAYSTRSPYAEIGAARETLQVMSYEPMVLLMAVAFFQASGSFDVAEVLQLDHPIICTIWLVFLGVLFILTIKLRKSPFDLSMSHHAHQEIVRGMTTEMSGPTLGMVEIMHWCENVLFLGYIATIAVPWQAYMVPQFMMMRSWHLNNTHLAIICLQAFSAFGVFMMKQFYEGVPTELCEAARIDGLSEYGIYARIMLPLSLPAVSTLVIFTFVNTWNDFLGPLIYLTKTELKTIQIGLRMFISQYSAEYGLIMAASVIALIPVLIVFLSLQKYFVQGVASSGLKG